MERKMEKQVRPSLSSSQTQIPRWPPQDIHRSKWFSSAGSPLHNHPNKLHGDPLTTGPSPTQPTQFPSLPFLFLACEDLSPNMLLISSWNSYHILPLGKQISSISTVSKAPQSLFLGVESSLGSWDKRNPRRRLHGRFMAAGLETSDSLALNFVVLQFLWLPCVSPASMPCLVSFGFNPGICFFTGFFLGLFSFSIYRYAKLPSDLVALSPSTTTLNLRLNWSDLFIFSSRFSCRLHSSPP